MLHAFAAAGDNLAGKAMRQDNYLGCFARVSRAPATNIECNNSCSVQENESERDIRQSRNNADLGAGYAQSGQRIENQLNHERHPINFFAKPKRRGQEAKQNLGPRGTDPRLSP